MSGFLEVGTNGKGEVVINHPDLKPDKEGVGHIVFSQEEARNLAVLLLRKANEARHETVNNLGEPNPSRDGWNNVR